MKREKNNLETFFSRTKIFLHEEKLLLHTVRVLVVWRDRVNVIFFNFPVGLFFFLFYIYLILRPPNNNKKIDIFTTGQSNRMVKISLPCVVIIQTLASFFF